MDTSQIIIETDQRMIRVVLEELLYITTVKNQDHVLQFITKNKTYYSRGVLKNYINKNYPTLFRCHRSTIVNLQAIREINKSEKKIYFINDEKNCHFSKRKGASLSIQWKKLLLHNQK